MEQALSGMLLSSSTYFIFLTALFFLYWPLSRWRAAGLAVILFGNYFFYAKWDLFYLGLIPLVSSCDYVLALLIENSQIQGLRRRPCAPTLPREELRPRAPRPARDRNSPSGIRQSRGVA